MVANYRLKVPTTTSLESLIKGFILTKKTDSKSPMTVKYYEVLLHHFLWYTVKENFPSDAGLITEWPIRAFLNYVISETNRWGLKGNGSEPCQRPASTSTLHHYFAALRVFFNWCVAENFLVQSPLIKIKVSNPKPKVIQPYSSNEIAKILAVCDSDYQHNAKFLGSRNKAIVLMLLDTGLRVSEIGSVNVEDVDIDRGWVKVKGKCAKERVVRIGSTAQKALWRYLIHRPNIEKQQLWLTEEQTPLRPNGIQMVIKRLKQRAGVISKGNCHRFRHTFALNFLRADRNPFNLQYLLGHSDLRMVRHYTATLGMEDALKAHEKASPADLLNLK
jgi:site-specific recombinase XerD